MSKGHHEAIQVSAEEERYLRRAFRRFALPYLLLVIAITSGALAWSAAAPRVVNDAPDELQSLVAESAALREAIASLREQVREQVVQSEDRLVVLEGGLERLRSVSAGESSAELGDRLDHAHQRINALEARLHELQASRVASPAPSPAPALPEATESAPAPAGPAAAQRDWPPSDPSFDRP